MTFNKLSKQLFLLICGVITLMLIAGSIDTAVADAEHNTQLELLEQPCYFSGRLEEATKATNSTDAIISTGSIFFDCTHGVILKTESIEQSVQILTLDNINFRLDKDSNLELFKGVSESLQAKLILSLIRADEIFINQHFEINEEAATTLNLKPVSKTYKRGLESLSLSKSGDDQQVVDIKIIDRRGRETNTKISRNLVYDTPETALAACQELYTGYDYCNILSGPEFYQIEIK